MKVQELRQLLISADRNLLEKAFVESYKQFSKGQKEDVDSLIRDVLEGKDVKKTAKNTIISFQDLEQQITLFIENARAQNYLAPNRIIPKHQRPKWRFLVKQYIKELEKIPTESEHYFKSVSLLTDLYSLICEACNYYLFSTDDPFRSIGWAQPDFFQLVVKRTFAAGYSKETISALLLSAATGGLSRESLHLNQELVLLQELKTSDVKYMAMEEAMKLVAEKSAKLDHLGKYDNQRYDLEDSVNELCAMVLLIAIALAEPEDGIKYYFKNCREQDKEITLYRALDLVDCMGEDKLWLSVYEYGLKKKIKPREYLAREYQERKSKK
ncbi:hypothetical protein NIA71_15615 [Ihubacter massiliensis]|uniref:Uncharacterized protein n=1 Tax=Hominibacterium faecale TaxID=2839743 RepID=A0A9J6QVX7_9FIRM|nr:MULTISPECIES: hypothetical protein [Eubacteriales Family XIII. Incertae Sedis]MCI7304141.1 hypothetical protein [Clostridia bacterium]MDE8734621.1 hypothetical protein [Eubacteriales bacterium DFI.9.88]MDY3011794.1 hypothetical protein [Clostridiales Family XIII bacterium]MCO7123378.1 hypothetical protein [Ihubacter massiliensis]MCU7379679.1 hypothetical protein [Hominibacterium faecale]